MVKSGQQNRDVAGIGDDQKNAAFVGKRQIEAKVPTLSYQPMLVACLALACGIVADRMYDLGFATPLICSTIMLGLWLLSALTRRPRTAVLLLLVSIAALGAAWHHSRWNQFSESDIGLIADGAPQPVCLRAVADTKPRWIPAPEPTPLTINNVGDASQVNVRVTAIRDGSEWKNVSGKAELFVAGQLLNVNAGDEVEIFGLLSSPNSAANPGEFDFYQQYRSRRCLARVFVGHPSAIEVVKQSQGFRIDGPVDQLRGSLNKLLWQHVDHRRAALASAILLGNREQIGAEQQQSFMETGTVHLLAISGLHVGILAASFLLLGRIGLLPRGLSLIATIVFVILYAWIVEFRPPVTRAMILIVLYCLGKLIGRQPISFNSLSLAAVLVIAVNPAELFQTGAQLSFLAVATIVVCQTHFFQQPTLDPLTQLIAQTRPWYVKLCKYCGSIVWRTFVVSFAIWLVTVPLVASRFHVVAPVGIVLNPLLMIPIWFALISGFAVMMLGWVFPLLGAMLGNICDWNLSFIQTAVDRAEPLPGSHLWVAGQNDFWLMVFYGGLALLFLFPVFRIRLRWLFALLVAWFAATLLLPDFGTNLAQTKAFKSWRDHQNQIPSKFDERTAYASTRMRRPNFRCTVISVGHGTSVLLEFPNGTNVLYDAGGLSSPARACRQISSVLWFNRVNHLDAIIISHADADHYNAVPDLLERFSVGTVIVSPQMFTNNSPALQFLRRAIERSGTVLQTAEAGDRLNCDPDCQVLVIQPTSGNNDYTDNANSIVLSVEAFGKRLLLPGDLEAEGMQQLLERPTVDFDAVMAPHHGSEQGEHAAFAKWCAAEYVVISSDDAAVPEQVQQAYESVNATVFNTGQAGAVQFEFTENSIMVRTWNRER